MEQAGCLYLIGGAEGPRQDGRWHNCMDPASQPALLYTMEDGLYPENENPAERRPLNILMCEDSSIKTNKTHSHRHSHSHNHSHGPFPC